MYKNYSCCVVNCENKGVKNGCKMYRFPTAKHKIIQRNKWIAAVQRKNPDGSEWHPRPFDRICTAHFIGNKKSEEELSPSYVPTIFSPVDEATVRSKTQAMKRHDRFMNRRIVKQEPLFMKGLQRATESQSVVDHTLGTALELFNINGSDTECIINLQDTKTETEYIEANVKFDLTYNLHKKPSPLVLKDAVQGLNAVNPLDDSDHTDNSEAMAEPSQNTCTYENVFEEINIKIEDEESDILYSDIHNESKLEHKLDVMQELNAVTGTIDTDTISHTQAYENPMIAIEETKLCLDIPNYTIYDSKIVGKNNIVHGLNHVSPMDECCATADTNTISQAHAYENPLIAIEDTKLYLDIPNYTPCESKILDEMEHKQDVVQGLNRVNGFCSSVNTSTISQSQVTESPLIVDKTKLYSDISNYTPHKSNIFDEIEHKLNVLQGLNEVSPIDATLDTTIISQPQVAKNPLIASEEIEFKIECDDTQILTLKSEMDTSKYLTNQMNTNLTSNKDQINSTTTESYQINILESSNEIQSKNMNLLIRAQPVNTISCNYCGHPFNTYKDLKQHIKKLNCKKCNTQFEAWCQFKVHDVSCIRCRDCRQHFHQEHARTLHNSRRIVSTCNICNTNFKTICLLQQHKVSNHPDFQKCATCYSFFETSEAEHHILDPNKSYQCVKCMCVFSSICLMKIHQNYCYKCNSCNIILTNIRSTKTHKSNDTGHYCCKKRFTSLCMLNRHINKPHCKREIKLSKYNFEYECKVCLSLFETEHLLNIHSKEHENTKCDMCYKVCRDHKHLKKHQIACIRFNRDGHICPTCGVTTTTKNKLTKHMVTHLVDRPYPCNICGKTFKSPDLCKRHKVIHTDLKLFTCKICNKKFKTKRSERFHTKQHVNSRKFKCVVCHQGFNRKDTLQIHMSKHKLSKDFKCEICGKEFAVKYYLNWHMKEHTEKHRFKCKTCERSFVYKKSFQSHSCEYTKKLKDASVVNINGVEYDFKCDTCSRTFKFKSQLEGHIRIHTGEKPFKCEVCHREFRLQTLLRHHMTVHSADKPFKCTKCGAGFGDRSHLARHCKIHL